MCNVTRTTTGQPLVTFCDDSHCSHLHRDKDGGMPVPDIDEYFADSLSLAALPLPPLKLSPLHASSSSPVLSAVAASTSPVVSSRSRNTNTNTRTSTTVSSPPPHKLCSEPTVPIFQLQPPAATTQNVEDIGAVTDQHFRVCDLDLNDLTESNDGSLIFPTSSKSTVGELSRAAACDLVFPTNRRRQSADTVTTPSPLRKLSNAATPSKTLKHTFSSPAIPALQPRRDSTASSRGAHAVQASTKPSTATSTHTDPPAAPESDDAEEWERYRRHLARLPRPLKQGKCVNPPAALRSKDPTKNIYTWAEIKKHNNKLDCWLVVRGKVYDVTEFLPRHPAGVQSIARCGGTDASEHYDFHSSRAHQIWSEFEIGRLDGYKEETCSVM